jgi:drug/metabolite transporter (DMT)-like permease
VDKTRVAVGTGGIDGASMTDMTKAPPAMHPQDWLLLILLSILWGGTFFAVGFALRELPPLTLVFARVALAAVLMLPVMWLFGMALPRTLKDWMPFAGISVFNNIVPYSLIFAGQTYISSGMASVLNATTPLFTVLVLAVFGEERLSLRRVAGVSMGVAGVLLLRGAAAADSADQTIGILLCLGGALCYGIAGLWGRRMLAGVPPMTSTTCQLIVSGFVMAIVAGIVDRPWTLPMPSPATWVAIVALAALSTALAYIVFFRILDRSGPTNVALVTLLIPVTAILLGVLVLGEPLTAREILGALVIGISLLVIDGRVFDRLRRAPGA